MSPAAPSSKATLPPSTARTAPDGRARLDEDLNKVHSQLHTDLKLRTDQKQLSVKGENSLLRVWSRLQPVCSIDLPRRVTGIRNWLYEGRDCRSSDNRYL